MLTVSRMSLHRCNLVVPGFGKCGTSSFHEYLGQHPDICMSKPKESHYFSVNKRWEAGVETHNAMFSGAPANCKYYGESSTTYCIYEPAIKRIQKSLDTPKILILIRDPIERTISHYNWLYLLGLEKRPILDAIEQSGHEFDPDNSIMGNYFGYLAFSAYSKFVPLWKNAFGEGNVMLVETCRLKANPKSVLNSVFHFLELPEMVDLELVNKNLTVNTRPINQPVWAVLANKLVPASLKSLVKSNSLAISAWRYLVALKRIKPPVVTLAEMETLAEVLEEDMMFYEELFATNSSSDMN